MKSCPILLIAMLLFSFEIRAQNEGNAAVILEFPANTRAMSLGNAFVMSTSHPDAVFYNPARVASGSGFAVGMQRFTNAATMLTASSSSGAFGFGIQAFSFSTNSIDLLANPVTIEQLTTASAFAASELVGTISYTRELFGFDIGIAAKWLEERVGGTRAGVAAADIGLSREVGPLTMGAAVQNIGQDVSLGATDLPMPLRIGFGVSTDVEQLGPLDVAVSGSIYRLHDGELVAGGGVEFAYWPVNGRTFTGRIGAIREAYTGTVLLTVGGAITLDNVSGSYALQSLSGSGSLHRVSLHAR